MFVNPERFTFQFEASAAWIHVCWPFVVIVGVVVVAAVLACAWYWLGFWGCHCLVSVFTIFAL